jgi:hypothetical protein
MSTYQFWTPDDSDALDQQVRAFRVADKRDHPGERWSTLRYDRLPRGAASDAELQRRAEVAKRMRRNATRPSRAEPDKPRAKVERDWRIRWPKPRQKPNGRWHAATTDEGEYHSKTFDTEQEAQAWLDAITGRRSSEH